MKTFSRHAGCRAFTLFEMVVVVGIFILLAGGIYATVNAAMRATATLTDENLEAQRLNAFVTLLRRTFHNLPSTAKFSGGVRLQDGNPVPEIVLRDAPGVFAWGPDEEDDATVFLSARPRLGGGRELSLLQLPGSLTEIERRDAISGGKWLRLLPDLRSATWRFYNPSQQDWVEEWVEGAERPPLLELNLELLGEGTPRRYIFWLPAVKEYVPSAAAAAPSTEANPTPQPPQTP